MLTHVTTEWRGVRNLAGVTLCDIIEGFDQAEHHAFLVSRVRALVDRGRLALSEDGERLRLP